MPGIGEWPGDEAWQAISESPEVRDDLDNGIESFRSFVVDNKLYCVYHGPDQRLVRRHAESRACRVTESLRQGSW